MTSPYADIANCRIAWRLPAAVPDDLRDGFAATAEPSIVVIEAFVKPAGGGSAPGGERESAVTVEGIGMRGNITRYATVPDGATWLDAGTGWSWITTGLRPDGLMPGTAEFDCYRGPLTSLPAVLPARVGRFRFTSTEYPYGDGGIGELLRAEAGDQFEGVFRVAR